MKKKLTVLCILALVSSIAFGDKAETESSSEVVILGSYFNFSRDVNSSGSSSASYTESGTPTSPTNPTNPVSPVNPVTPVNPGLISVVRENGFTVVGKSNYGEIKNYTVSGNIVATDMVALWVSDTNTSVTNIGILSSNYTVGNSVSVSVEDGANFINNGTISGGTSGLSIRTGSRGINNGIIDNLGFDGMTVGNGSEGINGTSGIIKNGGNYGMSAYGIGTKAINNGIIENGQDSGMLMSSGSQGVNNGIIRNHGSGGMVINSGSQGINNGLIDNGSGSGMVISGSGSLGINETSGIMKSGMGVGSAGQGINKGLIDGGGMAISGSGSLGVNENTGIIKGNVLIADGAQGINKGIVEGTMTIRIVTIGSSQTMGINDSTGTIGFMNVYNDGAQGINNGLINGIGGNYGMRVDNQSIGINNGTIEIIGNSGVLVTGGTMTNNGVIKNQGRYGIEIYHLGSLVTNEITGVISNTGDYGVSVNSNNTFINKGLIDNGGNYGVYTQNALGIGTNDIIGVISNGGNYGMSTKNGLIINKGTIENRGNYGMYIEGANGEGRNYGTIHLVGNNKTGVLVNFGGTFINNGIIQIDGTNSIGIAAKNNSTVKIGQNSQIILNGNAAITQSSTDYTDPTSLGLANSNSGGKAYDLDATSTLINAGTILTSSLFSVGSTGKFVLDTKTGVINAGSIYLEGDMYVNAEGTADSSENQYTFEVLNTSSLTGSGNVVSDSYLFTSEVEQNSSGTYSIIMTRKNFQDVFTGKFGNLLEQNYDNSENNISKNKIYNSLKINITTEEQANLAEREITNAGIVSNLMYQGFNINKVLDKSVNALLEQRNNGVDHGLYINFIGSETNADTEDNSLGFKDKSLGMTIGIMKKIGEKTSVGGFLGYLNSDVDYKDNNNSNQESDTIYINGSLVTDLTEKIKWTNNLSYNYGRTDVSRKITYDRSYQELTGDFNSWSVGGRTEIEYTQDLGNRINIRPSFGINVDYLNQEAYTETGSEEYNVKVNEKDGTSVRAELGLKSDIIVYNTANTKFKAVPSVSYSYELGNPYGDRDVFFTTFDDGISVSSREVGKNQVDLGLNLVYDYKSLSLLAGYNMGLSKDSQDQNMNVGFKYKW